MASTKATIPIKLLFEGVDHLVTVEMKNQDSYRGKLVNVEESMNCLLENVTKTKKSGETQTLEQVHLRGSHIRLFQLPELLKHARLFASSNKAKAAAGAAGGRGKGRNVAAFGAKVGGAANGRKA
eukprot:g4433.t1